MLYYLKEYAKYVEITGYANTKFETIDPFLKANRKEALPKAEVQFFDAELIAAWQHLYFAVLNALEAFKNKTNISKSLAMEAMLYASAQRQILKAIQRCGIKPETKSMAVVIIADSPAQVKSVLEAITECVAGEPDDCILEVSTMKEKRIRESYQISDEELRTVMDEKGSRCEALVNLVVERVALLATQL
jgi:tRNA threonylcarbamoyladenosine modification (KEOPS) complex Cgi121 subunit